MATTATVPGTTAEVTARLESKSGELQQLQQRLTAATRVITELRSAEKELQVDLANDVPGADTRLQAVHLELEIAAGKVSGLEQMIAAAQPELAALQQQQAELKRAEVRAARQAEIDRLTGELSALDTEILGHQSTIGDLQERRRGVFEARLQLMKAQLNFRSTGAQQ